MTETNKPKQLILTLKLPQSINKIYRKSQYGVYMTSAGKSYKEEMTEYVAMEAMHQEWTKVENRYLYMDEIVYMNKKGRDSDNLKKLTQDVITESNAVWTDDTYCMPRTNRIYIDKNNPRLEIIITPCEFIGIFNNEDELNNFKNEYCLKCKNYQKRINICHILSDSIDNRIRKEIIRDENAEDNNSNKLKCTCFELPKQKKIRE